LKVKTISIILIHAFVGWVFCGVTMGICMALTTIDNALDIHAALTPFFFFVVSMNYFRKYNHISPIKTATAFITFVILMDFFIVALLINRSLEMFSSALGTWIPFILIFSSTYITGTMVTCNRNRAL
jgi:hypothetical protein